MLTPDIIYEMVLDNLHCIGGAEPAVDRFIREFRAQHPAGQGWNFDKSRERNFRLFEALGKEPALCALYRARNGACYNFGPYPALDGQEPCDPQALRGWQEGQRAVNAALLESLGKVLREPEASTRVSPILRRFF